MQGPKHHLETLSPHTYQFSGTKASQQQAEDRRDGFRSETGKGL